MAATTREGVVSSRRTSVQLCSPRLDRCDETRTKQAIARSLQRRQSAPQPTADAPPNTNFRQQWSKRKNSRQRLSSFRTLCGLGTRSSVQRRSDCGRKPLAARGALFPRHECERRRPPAWGTTPDDAGRSGGGRVRGRKSRDERGFRTTLAAAGERRAAASYRAAQFERYPPVRLVLRA